MKRLGFSIKNDASMCLKLENLNYIQRFNIDNHGNAYAYCQI
jgi:hypothetical protein